jgi:hypothetical protein
MTWRENLAPIAYRLGRNEIHWGTLSAAMGATFTDLVDRLGTS